MAAVRDSELPQHLLSKIPVMFHKDTPIAEAEV